MKKICVVVTARTSYTKLKPIIKSIKAHSDLSLQLICAGSALIDRYGAIDGQIEQDGFTIDERIHMIVEGESLLTSAKTTGLGMIEFASAYNQLKPDAVLVMADRYEQMAPSVAAAYMNIPLVHIQGGEVSGNIDEKVRHAITKLADLHFPATEQAKEWIIKMGEKPDSVILSGCPSTDICQNVIDNPDLNFELYDKYGGVGAHPDINKDFIIVMQHPVTTEYGDARAQAKSTLEAIHDLGIPTLWFWPNIDAGADQTSKAIRVYRENSDESNFHFFRNMEPEDFLRLLYRARVIVGNSSCAIRESSYLGTPAVNIGSRQKNRECADNVMHCGYEKEDIKRTISEQLKKGRRQCSHLYGQGNAGEIIANTLAKTSLTFHKQLSYTKS